MLFHIIGLAFIVALLDMVLYFRRYLEKHLAVEFIDINMDVSLWSFSFVLLLERLKPYWIGVNSSGVLEINSILRIIYSIAYHLGQWQWTASWGFGCSLVVAVHTQFLIKRWMSLVSILPVIDRLSSIVCYTWYIKHIKCIIYSSPNHSPWNCLSASPFHCISCSALYPLNTLSIIYFHSSSISSSPFSSSASLVSFFGPFRGK